MLLCSYTFVWIDIFDSSFWFSVAKSQSLIIWDIFNRLFFFQVSGFCKQYIWEFKIRDWSDNSVKCLPCKHEHLSLICRTCLKKKSQDWCPRPESQHWEGSCWPISPAQLVSHGSVRDPVSKIRVSSSWAVTPKVLWSPHESEHTHRSDWLWGGVTEGGGG